MTEAGPANEAAAFGIDAFALDDRMRLFHFLAAEKRTAYLWILRAFDRSRANYQVLLHTADVSAQLAELAAEHPECRGARRPRRRAGRAGRLGEPGPRAGRRPRRHRAGVPQPALGLPVHRRRLPRLPGRRAACSRRRLDDATLSRLVLPRHRSPTCTRSPPPRTAGDAEEVYRKLTRLDRALADMAERAARFYLHARRAGPHHGPPRRGVPGAQGRPARAPARVPLRAAALQPAAARRGRSPSRPPGSSGCWSWPRRPTTGCSARLPSGWPTGGSAGPGWWPGSARAGGRPREADRLQQATVSAIGDVLALLRRVTEARRGGVSRESQLRHLAAWFAGCPSEGAAHALFDAVFALRTPRHVGIAHADPEAIPARRTWWEAPAVEVSRTLVETGRSPGPGRPAAGRPRRRGPAAPARATAGPGRGAARRRGGARRGRGARTRAVRTRDGGAAACCSTWRWAPAPRCGRRCGRPARRTASAWSCARAPARARCRRCAARCTSTACA